MTTKYKLYKHPKYGMVYGEARPTPEGRLVWPSLVEPKDPPPPEEGEQPGSPRYESTILLSKDSPEVANFLADMKAMTDEMLILFNLKRPAKLGQCDILKDGDAFDMEKYPYYKNNWVVLARNKEQPKCIGANKKPLEDLTVLKGGCLVKGVITPLITGHGISYKLEVIQFIKDDGTRFGGGVKDLTSLLEACEDDNNEQEPVTPGAAAIQSAVELL